MSEKFEALRKNAKSAANEHDIEPAISDDVATLSKAELEERNKAIDMMDSELKEIYEKELTAYKEHKNDTIEFQYDRGVVAAEIRRNPKYGDSAINVFSTALGVDKSTVYKTIKLSYMYVNKNELNKVVSRAEERGLTLTWSHFATVMHVPDSDEGSDPHANRRNMIELAIENNLSVRALANEVKLEYGKSTAKKTSSARANVKSLFKQILNGNTRFSIKLKNQADELIRDFDEAIESGSDADIKECAENAVLLRSSLEAISELTDRVSEWVDKFPNKIKSVVEERNKLVADRDDEPKRKKIAR